MKALKATYDGEKVILDEEITLPKYSKLIVIVPENDDFDWYSLSSRHLNRAYGEKEPKYSISEVKEPNPDYESR